jgi:hypothetical protein
MTTTRLTESAITVSLSTGTDVRSLSDHENRLHFFDRFAKDGETRPVRKSPTAA